MKAQVASLAAVLALLLVGGVALAQSGPKPPGSCTIPMGRVSGGHYVLSTSTWPVSGIAESAGYRLEMVASPALTGSGCCCIYLPVVRRS